MRTRWIWTAVALAACTGRTTGCSACIGHGAVSAGADEACTDWATRSCNRLTFCAPVSVQSDYGAVATCIARNKTACVLALQAPGTRADANTIRTCAQAYDSASCDDVVVAKPPEQCNVPGALPAGAACFDNGQCAGQGAYCRRAPDQMCGVCATLGPPGAACDSARDCQYGLVCFFTCTVPVAKGGACDGMKRQCAETLVCFNYVCVAPAEAGEPCEPQADNCDHDHGVFCDVEQKRCAGFAVAEPGAICGIGTVCRAGTCMADEATQTSKCVANATDGSRCDSKLGPACTAPARCIDGTCQQPIASACN
jgi:hypothetical protein